MALQVWLPLTENLNNQGLSNINFTSSTSGSFTLNSSGKLGKCYAGYLLKHLSTDFLENKWTICLWVNNTGTWSANNDILLCKNINSASACQFYMSIINAKSFNIGVNAGSSTTSYSYTFNVNTWYHLAVSFDGSHIYMYINGILVKSVANTSTQLTGHLNLGIGCRSSNTNGTSSTGGNSAKLFNDVRIYDQCLSPKEVHEIAKGLVLHYKLDDITNINLVSSRKSYNPTSYQAYQFNLSENLLEGETYTFQLWNVDISHTGKTATQLGISIYWGGGSVALKHMNGTSWFTNGHADYIIFTITITSSQASGNGATNSWLNIYNSVPSASGTMNMSIGNIKVERGNVATPFNGSNSIIYDSSGYQNNGTVIGNLTITNITPRYNRAIYMNNTNTSNHIECDYVGYADDIFSISFWIKADKSISQVLFAHPKIRFGFVSAGIVVWPTSAQLFSKNNFITNEWNHIIIIRNNTEYKLYINGIEQQKITSTNWYGHNSTTKIYILNRDTNTNYAGTGYISDFRIYSTILSDIDILELYNIPTNIDNNGNMFSFEFDEEETNKQQILKTGITKINDFIEINDKIKVLSDGSAFLQILHHNNPASNLFTSSNCWLNNTENLYSALILLKNIFKDLTEYEFLACEKLESTSTEAQIRWKQTSNPAISSTLSGYTLISGSPGRTVGLINKGTYGCFHNGGTWWCCCGSYTAYQGGIPGFTNVVKSGYIDLYIRIPEEMLKGEIGDNLKFFKKSILSTQIIEK